MVLATIISMAFDTHFHLLSMEEKGIDTASLEGLSGMDIGCEPGDMEERLPLIEKHPGLYCSVAAGPWCAKDHASVSGLVSRIEADIKRWKPHFIGEIGLDYYWKYGEEGVQEELFRAQLDLARETGLPVSIHNRDANEDTVRLLEEAALPQAGIIHCFSADEESLEVFLGLGYKISFAGNITYKANEELRRLMLLVPDDRLLLETDSPYLAPVPMRGRKNTPLNISYTYEYVAQLKGMAVEELEKLVEENFKAILGGAH